MELARAFGRELKRLRESSGLSQAELAKKADLNRTYISLLERGERQPTLSTLFSLAKSLGTKPAAIVRSLE